MYLSLNSASAAPGPHISHFMRLDRQDGHLCPLLADVPIPTTLLPRLNQPWPHQLGSEQAEPIEQLLRRGQAGHLCVRLEEESWLLEFVPELAPHWLICARPILANDSFSSSRGLAILDLEKQAAQPAGLARNRQVLERLQLMLGCDRLILWSQQQERLHPVFMLGGGELPATQTLELRYQKALRSRGILGFSNLTHQPMLQNQTYLRQEGILARLDVQLKFNSQPCGLLTLEYRSIQESFPPLSFHLAEKAAQLLMLPENLSNDALELTWLPEFNQTQIWLRDDAYWLMLAKLLADHGHTAQVMIFHCIAQNQHWHHLLTLDRGTRLPPLSAHLYNPSLQALRLTPAHRLSPEEIQNLNIWHSDTPQSAYYWYPVLNTQAEVVGAMILELYQETLEPLEQVLALTHYRTQAELMSRFEGNTEKEEGTAAPLEPSAQLTPSDQAFTSDSDERLLLVQQGQPDTIPAFPLNEPLTGDELAP